MELKKAVKLEFKDLFVNEKKIYEYIGKVLNVETGKMIIVGKLYSKEKYIAIEVEENENQ